MARNEALVIAAVQTSSRDDKAGNLDQAERPVAEAARLGAHAVVLPEHRNLLGEADLAQTGHEPTVVMGSLDSAMVSRVRQMRPSLGNRVPEPYGALEASRAV